MTAPTTRARILKAVASQRGGITLFQLALQLKLDSETVRVTCNELVSGGQLRWADFIAGAMAVEVVEPE
jgi:DNA-binding IclR family transcriptional regulator